MRRADGPDRQEFFSCVMAKRAQIWSDREHLAVFPEDFFEVLNAATERLTRCPLSALDVFPGILGEVLTRVSGVASFRIRAFATPSLGLILLLSQGAIRRQYLLPVVGASFHVPKILLRFGYVRVRGCVRGCGCGRSGRGQ